MPFPNEADTRNGLKLSIRIADEVSTSFVTLDELKQGDTLSNLLFNIALDGAIRRSGVQRNGTIITRLHMLFGFADDIDLSGTEPRAVEEGYAALKREAAGIGLTKYMITGRDRGRPSGVNDEVEIDGNVFEVVEEFEYFGCDNDVSREVKSRIAAANKAFYGLHNQLRSRNLQKQAKFALKLGHVAWRLKEIDQKAFEVFESKVPQESRVVPSVQRCEYSETYNIRQTTTGLDMSAERIAKTIFSREPSRCRQDRGRLRTRWLHAVVEDLRSLHTRGN